MTTEISRLFLYPIKSFRGVEIKKLELGPHAIRWDRKWMLVDEKNKFITQRELPALAKIGVLYFDDSHIELMENGELISDFGLEEKESDRLSVQLWDDKLNAFEVSGEVSDSLSKSLGRKVKLVRLDDAATRAGQFADAEPVMVLSEASLSGLEELAKTSVSLARFRPNVIVRNCPAHAEDHWRTIQARRLTLRRVRPCTRSSISKVHPLTGEIGEEPVRTLSTYRKLEDKIAFGQYYDNDAAGELTVGESLVCE